jgi:hypothetical protein
VTRGLEDALAALKPGLAGIDIDPTIFRPATFIESAIQNLALALGLALVLVAVTFLTLGMSIRAVVSVVAITVSMIAGGVLRARATLNAWWGRPGAGRVVIDDAVVGVAGPSADGGAADADASRSSSGGDHPARSRDGILVLINKRSAACAVGQFMPTMAGAYLLAIVPRWSWP